MTDGELFNKLSEPIRRFVYRKGWTSFRPIQRVSIERILSTKKNYILASRTASGKTEAALLPVISLADFSSNGVKVLYISPLIALINDQNNRVKELCQYLDITITKWHGEASSSAKQKLLRDPNGIVLITPESIQAMFDNHPDHVRRLFSHLQYVIIDEVHYFIGSDRGTQLQSLLARLKMINDNSFVSLGLSATIGDYTLAKHFFCDYENTSILVDSKRKPIEVYFHYYEQESKKLLPEELLNNLYQTTKDHKVLVFPSSRGRAEEVAVRLKQIAEKDNFTTQQYFSHHASLDRELREHVEFFAKHSLSEPYTICCTSTLELGIDIGSIDIICQIDATNSVSSLVQRAGRSGRSDNMHAILHVYSTSPLTLVRAIACWNLHERGIIESPQSNALPYDILLHQMLSIVREYNEIKIDDLVNLLHRIPVFSNLSSDDIYTIVHHLLSPDNQILESVGGALIIGIDGEKIVNNREFYSVFVSDKNLDVYADGKKIGELQSGLSLKVGSRIYLAAKVWRIDAIDYQRGKVFVVPDNTGRPPRYEGSAGDISFVVEQEMLQILYSNECYSFLDNLSSEVLAGERKKFAQFDGKIIPIEEDCSCTNIYLFFGSRINRTIAMLFDVLLHGEVELDDNLLRLPINKSMFRSAINDVLALSNVEIKDYLLDQVERNSDLLRSCSKYGYLLPKAMQIELLLDKYYDLSKAQECLAEL